MFYYLRYDDVDVVAIVIKDALMFQLGFLLSRFLAIIFFCYFRYIFVGELLMISRLYTVETLFSHRCWQIVVLMYYTIDLDLSKLDTMWARKRKILEGYGFQ